MDARMSTELARELQALAQQQPDMKLPFIVTLAPGAKVQEQLPFKPTLTVEAIRMVAGEMTARQALDLARHAEVETVELDGEMHTQRGRHRGTD